MDYKKIYLKLCERGKTFRSLEYFEKHHIIPRCLGGDNSDNNLTNLTAKEHYIAHLLLTKIYDKSSLLYAFGMMQSNTKRTKRYYKSSQYEKMRIAFSKAMKKNNPMFNEKTRKKISDTRKKMFRDGSLTPIVFSDETKKRLSENIMGDKNPIRIDPSKNRTAQPIRIHFEDGRTEDYKYAKEFCIKNNVPYATMKFWLRNNSKSKKYKIIKIERLEKI